jgi:hypothetical protein
MNANWNGLCGRVAVGLVGGAAAVALAACGSSGGGSANHSLSTKQKDKLIAQLSSDKTPGPKAIKAISQELSSLSQDQRVSLAKVLTKQDGVSDVGPKQWSHSSDEICTPLKNGKSLLDIGLKLYAEYGNMSDNKSQDIISGAIMVHCPGQLPTLMKQAKALSNDEGDTNKPTGTTAPSSHSGALANKPLPVAEGQNFKLSDMDGNAAYNVVYTGYEHVMCHNDFGDGKAVPAYKLSFKVVVSNTDYSGNVFTSGWTVTDANGVTKPGAVDDGQSSTFCKGMDSTGKALMDQALRSGNTYTGSVWIVDNGTSPEKVQFHEENVGLSGNAGPGVEFTVGK